MVSTGPGRIEGKTGGRKLANSAGNFCGGLIVKGFIGTPEQSPGYSSEHSVPAGQLLHDSPGLYISEPNKFAAKA